MSVFDVTTNTHFATLSTAIAGSHANDVIQVTAGSYVENFPNITHNLTIESVGGLAYLSTPQPEPVNGRAILNVPGEQNVSLTISGLVLSGAVDSGDNGAGILFENGNAALTVRNSWIHGNQDGILTGAAEATSIHGMTVTVQNSEIDDNGTVPGNSGYGFDHNLYVGAVTRFTITHSYIHAALGGHEIKSRALTTIIANNRIIDGPTAGTSYSIDLPYGGTAIVSGNVIEKGPAAENHYFIHFAGEDGVTYPGSSLLVQDNTIVNDYSDATLLLNQSQDLNGHTIPAVIDSNMIYNVATNELYRDSNPPPADTIADNTFVYGPDPRLNTAHLFKVPPSPIPAPPATSVFPLALLLTAMLRYRRVHRRIASPRPATRAPRH